MDRTLRRLFCWIVFYLASLAVFLAGAALADLAVGLPGGLSTGVALWLLLCFSSLCFPENIWDRWLPGSRKR